MSPPAAELPVACPVAEALAGGAAALGLPELGRIAAGLAAPVRVGVNGRPGAGRTTVARALRTAGISVAAAGETPDLVVYVFVETLTPEDRTALSGFRHPCVAVLNKADLAGFGGPGPMATAGTRCRALERTVTVPVVPVAALLVRSALDDALLDGLAALTGCNAQPLSAGQRLLAELDLYGVAVAVAALQAGVHRTAVAAELWRVSGVDGLVDAVDRTTAEVRYRRATSALTALAGRSASSSGGPIADFLAGDALVLARMAAAASVVRAAGLSADRGRTAAEHLRGAVAWERYAGGPVSELHRACGADIARGALRLWARAEGGPRTPADQP